MTRRALSCPELREVHVSSILRIIQALCRKHYLDYEAALIILQLLCGMYHFESSCTECLKSFLIFNFFVLISERLEINLL